MKGKRLVVFASGNGSNFQALVERLRGEGVTFPLLVSDNPIAYCLQRAKTLGVPQQVVDYKEFDRREHFDRRLLRVLEDREFDAIALAGFMRVLSPDFVRRYAGRIVNVHPSLLPAFPGLNAVKQALDYGVKFTGVTVHLVDKGVDTGPIVAQEVVKIEPDDTLERLTERIHAVEHRLYPDALARLLPTL